MKKRGAKENLDAGKIAGRRPKQSTPVDIHIGSRLRQRRTALGMTQEEIATAQGLPLSAGLQIREGDKPYQRQPPL